VAAGLVHAVTAYAPLPDAVAWIRGRDWASYGRGACAASPPRGEPAGFAGGVPSREGLGTLSGFPCQCLVSCDLGVVRLSATASGGWVVGARYFYLPAVGLVLMLALGIDTRGAVGAMVAIALLAVMGLGSTATRMAEVRRYRAVVAAARVAVTKGAQAGHTIFLVRNGVKDLGPGGQAHLASGGLPQSLLVIPDVPASFVWMPDGLASPRGFSAG